MIFPTIRPMGPHDVAALLPVLEATGLFPADLLAPMFDALPRFGAPPALWHVAEVDGQKVGFAFSEPESFTEAAWNMRAIAVAPRLQARGIGRALIAAQERAVRHAGGAILIVDTADVPEFEAARGFYTARGYQDVARIADFWAPGVDKITFRKAL